MGNWPKKIPEKRLKRRMTGAMFGWAAVPASCTSSRVSMPITWVMDTYGVLKSCENVSTPLSLGEPVGYSSHSWKGGRFGRRWGNGGWPYLSWPQIFWAHLKIVSVWCGCLAMVVIYFFCFYNCLYQKLRASSDFFGTLEILYLLNDLSRHQFIVLFLVEKFLNVFTLAYDGNFVVEDRVSNLTWPLSIVGLCCWPAFRAAKSSKCLSWLK